MIGHSVRGRPIHAYRVGPPARRKLLVFGLIHGDESAGVPVARRLRRVRPPRGVELLLVGDLKTRNVIGHNENRSSPFHRERVPRFRNQTHGDFRRRSMNRYRRGLRRMPRPSSVR